MAAKPKKADMVAVATEMNVLLKPDPPIDTDAKAPKLMTQIKKAAGLLEKGDEISKDTAKFFNDQEIDHDGTTKAAKKKKAPEKKAAPAKKKAPKEKKEKRVSPYGAGIELMCKEPDIDRKKFMKALEKKVGSENFKQSAANTAYSCVKGIVAKLRANDLMKGA